MSEINDIPVETIDCRSKPLEVELKIDTEEFSKELQKILESNEKVWRSSKVLSEKLKVDALELDKYLQKRQDIVCRPSKDEGVFFYALLKRLATPEKIEEIKKPLVTEADRYYMAMLHMIFMNLSDTLEKAAVRIHERDSEAFNNLVMAKNKLEVGLVFYANSIKADVSKLPKLRS